MHHLIVEKLVITLVISNIQESWFGGLTRCQAPRYNQKDVEISVTAQTNKYLFPLCLLCLYTKNKQGKNHIYNIVNSR